MRILILITLMLFSAEPVLAGEKKAEAPALGQLIGPDGKKWIVEGCAAYPVEQTVKTNTKTTQMSKWIKPAKQPPKPKLSKRAF